MSKQKKKSKISFIGMAAEQVTGSMYLLETNGSKILIECGGSQTNNIEKDYQTNSRQFDFKARELDYVVLGHSHIDHIFLVPRLIKEGFNGRIIIPKGNYNIMKILWEDSAHIISKDCEYLNKSRTKKYQPIYEQTHVDMTMSMVDEYSFDKRFKLTDDISFEFYPSQHIMNSAQVMLYVKNGSKTSKILYTSDIGNIRYGKSNYTTEIKRVESADIVIGETTYCSEEKSARGAKDRERDLEKLKSVIDNYVIEKKSKVLLPVFANHRCQSMLKFIYDLYKDSGESFNVAIDSPMAIKITKEYSELLKGKEKREYDKMLEWDKLRFIDDFESSQACISSNIPMVVLSASGMMTAGRSIGHLQSIIEDPKSCVVICGYASPNTLSGKIKEGAQKEIEIGGKTYKNKVQLTSLVSMSSHMQYSELLDYYSSINCNSIYLVHGGEDRIKFAQTLEDKYRELNKTTKVYVGFKGFEIEF